MKNIPTQLHLPHSTSTHLLFDLGVMPAARVAIEPYLVAIVYLSASTFRCDAKTWLHIRLLTNNGNPDDSDDEDVDD